MNINYDSKEFKLYRKAYVTQCTLEHLLGLLVLDAFLAKLLTYIGMSDAMVGVITSFTSVAFIFQLLSILLVQSKLSTKKMVIAIDGLSMLLFMLIYFVPFVPLQNTAKKLFVMVAVMIAQASKCVISTLYFKWANAYVPPEDRAVFSAKKEMISLLCGIVFSAVMGLAIDKFESIGNIKGGFLFIATSMLIINILNFISLVLIKDEDISARESMRISTRQVMKDIFSDKIFLNYFLVGIPAAIASGMCTGFIGVYKIKDLAMSLFLVQAINIAADFLRMTVSIPFATYSKKHGFLRGLQLASVLTGISYLTIVFTTPDTWYLVIIYTFLYTCAAAGNYQNSFNVYYVLVPQKYMTQAMAFIRTFTGIITFVSAIIGGQILNFIQSNNNMIFNIHIYAQQFLALLALPLWAAEFYLKYRCVIKPLEKREKEKNL